MKTPGGKVHYRTVRYAGVNEYRACRWLDSKSNSTREWKKVTCKRCIKLFAARYGGY